MDELRRLTPRGDVFERYVFDEEERPSSELLRQALNGRLDVLDDVGVVVCSLQRRSKRILCTILSLVSFKQRGLKGRLRGLGFDRKERTEP
jgi:hypothetical protein